MTPPAVALPDLLAAMSPRLNPGIHVSVRMPHELAVDLRDAMATTREPEALSLVLPATVAALPGLAADYRVAGLTLTVHSALQAVALTAAVAQALAGAQTSCNVIAGTGHDRLVVPHERAREAREGLARLQQRAAAA